MKRIWGIVILCAVVMGAAAIPARPGWRTYTQPDGSSIDVQIVGDEYYHYIVNRDGQRIEMNQEGWYEVVGNEPTPDEFAALRTQSKKMRSPRKTLGVTPNLAPRGIVIMINFADKSFLPAHTQAVVDSLCNAEDCKVNKIGNVHFPSAGQYFLDQSNGKYHPIFDVYGPVTLSHNMAYYGANDRQGNDLRVGVAVVEACKMVEDIADFTQYDSDHDGKVDFVYVMYAGESENATGIPSQIWPHSYSIDEEFEYRDPYFLEVYPTRADCMVDGKQINTYACSSELDDDELDGIGTLCHEFSHVLGLPDFYDTNYSTNYQKELTPNNWDVMDRGSYNGKGHCPPNYSPWEKFFFGWHNPINLGDKGRTLELKANGTDGYQAYQLNAIGAQYTATTPGLCYYFENRQKTGWDRFLPAAGLVIWRVDYDELRWKNNTPNNTANDPHYTVVCSNGTKVGSSNGRGNVFPYSTSSKTIDSWEEVASKPLKNIRQSGGIVTLDYIRAGKPALKLMDKGTIVIIRNGLMYDISGRLIGQVENENN